MNSSENIPSEIRTNLNYSDEIDDLDDPDQYIEQVLENEIDEYISTENNQISSMW